MFLLDDCLLYGFLTPSILLIDVQGCASHLIFNLVEFGLSDFTFGLSDFTFGHDWARFGELDENRLNFSRVISPGRDPLLAYGLGKYLERSNFPFLSCIFSFCSFISILSQKPEIIINLGIYCSYSYYNHKICKKFKFIN